MAGHSKWANIKHRKARQDAKRGAVFTKVIRELTVAAKEGGGVVEDNPRLRLAYEKALSANMGKDTINRAIQRGAGGQEGQNLEEVIYEGYGPEGIALFIKTLTDNKNRTVSEVRSYFGKLGGNMGETNSVSWNFERKGVINVKTNGISEDAMMEHVLESGADDLEYDEDTSRVICAMTEFGNVSKYFEESDLEVTESKLEYISKDTVKITDLNTAQKVMKFIDTFEDHDDVQNIYTNVEIDDSIAEQLM